MTRKILFSMLAGVFVMAMAGLAAAEAPVQAFEETGGLTYAEGTAPQPGADPEMQYSNSNPWQERGEVDTGSLPSMVAGDPELHCCNPSLDADGNTLIRPGIDDGQ